MSDQTQADPPVCHKCGSLITTQSPCSCGDDPLCAKCCHEAMELDSLRTEDDLHADYHSDVMDSLQGLI